MDDLFPPPTDPRSDLSELPARREVRTTGPTPVPSSPVSDEQRHEIRRLTELIADMNSLLRSTGAGTVLLDRELRIRKFAPQTPQVISLRSADVGRPIRQLAHGLCDIELETVARRVLDGGDPFERHVRHESGRWLLLRLLPTRARDRSGDGVVLSFVDITEARHARRQLELSEERMRALTRELEDQADRDSLTGLLNRRGLEKVLVREVGRCRRTGSPSMAALIGCDDFRRINDGLGHAVGDVVLRDVARRLLSSIRPHDCMARIGGDEFLVLLPDTRAGEAIQVGERLRRAISDCTLRVGDRAVGITASIGVVRVPPHVVSVAEVIGEARHALSHGKRNGKNRVAAEGCTAGPADHGGSEGLAELLLRDGALRVFAQPIHDLSEERIVGHELLSRGPRGTFESPYDFFRASVEKNILTLVDLRCLRNCIDVARRVRNGSGFHLNVLPSTMLDVPRDQMSRLFGEIDDPSLVCVEISEQQFIGDPACLDDHVLWLREAGFRVAIDDVGFGRSSLESLIVLHPDVIKIDRALVHGLAADAGKQRSLARLLKIGSCLETEIVAEGVETDADLRQLRAMGVRYAQGFLWERPSEVVPA